MRRELMIRLIRSFLAGTIEKDIDRIPYEIRPKGMDSVRCCIYKDRAIIKYRLMALLGASYEAETDESKTLKEYLNDALAEKKRPDKPITGLRRRVFRMPRPQVFRYGQLPRMLCASLLLQLSCGRDSCGESARGH